MKKRKTNAEQPFWVPVLAGATARIWAATLVSPVELIRTKMQSQRLSYAGRPNINFNVNVKKLIIKNRYSHTYSIL